MRTILGCACALAALAIAAAPASAAKPKLSVADVTVSEGAATAALTVTASKKAKKAISVQFATADADARAGEDYTSATGAAKIKKRKRLATLAVRIGDDALDEPDEAFSLRLSSPKRAKLGDGAAEVTIRDDDAAPRISVTTTSIPEGSASNQVRQLTVALTAASAKPVSINFASAGSTATSGADFLPASGTLNIPAGQQQAAIALTTVGDTTDEFDENLTIGLTNGSNAEPAEPVYAVTIADDDAAPTVSLSTPAVVEGTEGTFSRAVGVQLSAASAKPIDVDYATANGTATAPADFTATSGELAFAPGDTAESFNLTTVGDYADEDPNEALAVAFSNPVNVALPGSAQSLTITDDDAACVAADPITTNLNLGSMSGDAGIDMIQRVDDIDPCGDVDWYRFTLTEDSDSAVFLSAQVALQSTPNGSPSAGDVDLCARIGTVASTEECSTLSAGATELIDVCAEDHAFGEDDTTEFYLSVDGFGNAVSDNYTLTITGNTALGASVKVSSGAC